MAQLTPRGYTIPDGTDPISAGDDLLRANFTQIDGEITELADRPKILAGFGQTDAAGEFTLTWPEGTWDSTPRIILTVIEKIGVARVRGGATATSATIRCDDITGTTPSTGTFVNWLAVGAPAPEPRAGGAGS